VTTVAGRPSRSLSAVTRIAVLLALLVLVIYAAAVLWLLSQETRLVFQAGQPLGERRPQRPFTQARIPRADGLEQFAWIMPHDGDGGSRPWVLFLHGNASTIASRLNILHYEQLRSLGLNVLAPEYRGYAGLDGVPTERALETDARAAYDYARSQLHVPAERLIIFGWSLGSAVAVDLASKVDEAGLIVEGAPASIVDIGQHQYPFFPIRLLMRNPFQSIRKVRDVHSPMLFLHSPEDDLIPIGEGRRLFDAALPPKEFVEVRGGHVYASERDTAVFFGAVRHFLQTQHLLSE
jgi:fermentation-respiration switch protein FrsA (DUF1100 family)